MKPQSHQPALSQEVINLYDQYTHQPLSRRDFVERLARLMGGVAAAYAVLPLLENNYAQAEVIAAGDSRLKAEDVQFGQRAGVALSGYLVRPVAGGTLPAVVLVHENRGLNPHIRDVARRLALAGYWVLAPDYLSPLGGTPADEDQARELFAKLDAVMTADVSQVALRYLQAKGNGKVGAVGFCWGGGQVGQMAVRLPPGSEQRLTREAARLGIATPSLGELYHAAPHTEGWRLGFAALAPEAIDAACRALAPLHPGR